MIVEIIELCLLSTLAVSCPNPQYIGDGYVSVQDYLYGHMGEVVEFVDNNLVMNVALGRIKPKNLKFHANYLDPLIVMARLRYPWLEGRKILFVVDDSYLFEGLASPGSKFQGVFVRTKDMPGKEFYKTVAHELLHLKGYAHTCEIPDPKSATPEEKLKFKKCRVKYGNDIMHPYACPDKKSLDDCKFEGDHTLPDPWLE